MVWSLKLGKTFGPISFVAAALTLLSILCGDHAIKQIDKPFITASDTADDWAL